MGNHQTSVERRHKLGEPCRAVIHRMDGQAFVIDKAKKLAPQHSEEEHEPTFYKDIKPPHEGTDSEEALSSRVRQPLSQVNMKLIPYVIKWSGNEKDVQLSGTFNEWEKIPMVKSEKDFVMIVNLPEGRHEYKFMVDGEWKVNPELEVHETAPGEKHNVVAITQDDFDEFEHMFLNDAGDKKDVVQKSSSKSEEEYGQLIPDPPHVNEIVKGPPVLPLHLLQVILNKDTPLSCEPTLLPEPNHVMLNHVYALSIKDGVMVLSTTHRYHKKYVTTLIYRPNIVLPV